MGLRIKTLRQQEEERIVVTTYLLPARTYLTKNMQRAVKAGDKRAAYLLGPAGREIPLQQAHDLGVVKLYADDDKKKQQEPPDKKAKGAPPNKAAKVPKNK